MRLMHPMTCRPGDELCVNVHTCTVTTYRYVRVHDGTYRVILSIVKAGSEAPVQSQVAGGFSQFSKNIPEPFHHVYVCTLRVCGCVSATRILPKSLCGHT